MNRRVAWTWIVLGLVLIWPCMLVYASSCYSDSDCPGLDLCCSNSYCCGQEIVTVSMGAVIGIAVSCIVGCIACIVCCVLCCRRNNTYQGQVLSRPSTQVITTRTTLQGSVNPNQYAGYTPVQMQYPATQAHHPGAMNVPPPTYSGQYAHSSNPPGYNHLPAYQPQPNLPYTATQPAYPVGPTPYPGNQETKQGMTQNMMPSLPYPVHEVPQASAPPPIYTE